MKFANPMLSTALAGIMLFTSAAFTVAQNAKPVIKPQTVVVKPKIVIVKPKIKIPPPKIIIKPHNVSPKVVLPEVQLKEPGTDIPDRVRELEEAGNAAGEAGNLEGNSGAEATMDPAATADPSISGTVDQMAGTGIQTVNRMEELCKGANFRRLVRGLGLCAGFHDGSEPLIDPETGTMNYRTESPVGPGHKYHGQTGFGGSRAGDRVPRRNGLASDGEKPVRTTRHPDGRTTDVYPTHRYARYPDGTYEWGYRIVERDADKKLIKFTLVNTTGPDPHNGLRWTITLGADPSGVDDHYSPLQTCINDDCITVIRIDDQPGETGQAGGNFRSSFFCLQNPKNSNCQPLKAGAQIDPANPDGEGTAAARPQTETPRLGREAVSDPGPADSEIRGVSGGGSRPLDMKDPVGPTPPK